MIRGDHHSLAKGQSHSVARRGLVAVDTVVSKVHNPNSGHVRPSVKPDFRPLVVGQRGVGDGWPPSRYLTRVALVVIMVLPSLDRWREAGFRHEVNDLLVRLLAFTMAFLGGITMSGVGGDR